jgi:peroxiredoxin Q/BCP
MIAPGESMPAGIQLLDQDGVLISLDAVNRPMVLFFYPADHTPGCTAEVCSFRDAYEDFQDHGATVIGVSPDGGERHQSFIAAYNLPFPLLSDTGGKVAKQLAIPKALGFLSGRVTFVIDQDNIVRHVFKNQLQATKHIPEALDALARIAAKS